MTSNPKDENFLPKTEKDITEAYNSIIDGRPDSVKEAMYMDLTARQAYITGTHLGIRGTNLFKFIIIAQQKSLTELRKKIHEMANHIPSRIYASPDTLQGLQDRGQDDSQRSPEKGK